MDKDRLLKKIKVFVLDMDGTFYLGDRILPDSLRFIARVRETGRRFLFFTNNSSKTPTLYLKKLRQMGVTLERADILTSGDVCIDYLRKNHSGASVFLMGTDSLREDFSAAGVKLTGAGSTTSAVDARNGSIGEGNGTATGTPEGSGSHDGDTGTGVKLTSAGSSTSAGALTGHDERSKLHAGAGSRDRSLVNENETPAGVGRYDEENGTPDVVVCAFDTELTYAKLERACTFIRRGAVFLATHEDINCPTEGGFIPDCGAMCAAISLSTGRKPKYLGKPHAETVEKILSMTGASREEIAFVGDRLYTDIAAGENNGASGILVLSGETKEGDLAASPVKPSAVFSGLGEIADLL